MKLKWALAMGTHILAAVVELFMITVLFGTYDEVKNDPYAWVLIAMIVALSLASINNVFTTYCIVRYNNAEQSFSKSINYVYTGFIIFSILFLIALSYAIFSAWSTGFGTYRELSSQDRLGLSVIIFFSLLCLWNLIAQIQFRRYLKNKQMATLNELIHNIGQTLP